MKKVLITGSSGMLGSVLCKTLRKKYNIYLLDIIGTDKNFFKADIVNKAETENIITDLKPDIVIHAAAYTDVDGCQLNPQKAQTVNAEGTKNVTLACKLSNSSLIYISTDYVFDGKKKTAYIETDIPNPISAYGKSKLDGENYIKSILDKYIIIRSSGLYGAGGKNFVDTILDKAKKEKILKVVNDQTCSPTYVRDLSEAIGKLIDLFDSGQIIHITNSGKCSWYEFAKKILENKKTNVVKIKPITSVELGRPANRPANSVLDNTKYEKLTGSRMQAWQDALKNYITLKYKERL